MQFRIHCCSPYFLKPNIILNPSYLKLNMFISNFKYEGYVYNNIK